MDGGPGVRPPWWPRWRRRWPRWRRRWPRWLRQVRRVGCGRPTGLRSGILPRLCTGDDLGARDTGRAATRQVRPRPCGSVDARRSTRLHRWTWRRCHRPRAPDLATRRAATVGRRWTRTCVIRAPAPLGHRPRLAGRPPRVTPSARKSSHHGTPCADQVRASGSPDHGHWQRSEAAAVAGRVACPAVRAGWRRRDRRPGDGGALRASMRVVGARPVARWPAPVPARAAHPSRVAGSGRTAAGTPPGWPGTGPGHRPRPSGWIALGQASMGGLDLLVGRASGHAQLPVWIRRAPHAAHGGHAIPARRWAPARSPAIVCAMTSPADRPGDRSMLLARAARRARSSSDTQLAERLDGHRAVGTREAVAVVDAHGEPRRGPPGAPRTRAAARRPAAPRRRPWTRPCPGRCCISIVSREPVGAADHLGRAGHGVPDAGQRRRQRGPGRVGRRRRVREQREGPRDVHQREGVGGQAAVVHRDLQLVDVDTEQPWRRSLRTANWLGCSGRS